MNIFCLEGDYVNADFSSRHNLFALAWGGKTIVDRVIDRKVKSKGFVIPDKPHAQWTVEESLAYDTARRAANDGSAPTFDFLECYEQTPIKIVVDVATKTFKVNDIPLPLSFENTVTTVLINADGSLAVHSPPKTPGQSAAELPLGTYLAAQFFLDRSNDELYVVTFRRFMRQTVFTPSVTFSDTSNVHTRKLGVNLPSEVLPLVERLITKRWAIQRSPNYSTSIVQTRGLLDSPWVVLEGATFLRVPSKPQVVKFFLSRFFDKFDYQFKLSDFDIVEADGVAVAESPDGAMALTVSGAGNIEIVPKSASRIFLGEDVVRTSDLHLRLTVV